ncbi:MAG: hypothetical protein RI891_1545 [Gemmatimonadota bacterium]|jgi:hypothetical protein
MHSLLRNLSALRLALVSLGPILLSAQQPQESVPTARALRTPTAITLDGRDHESVWRTAPITDDFKQFSPMEAGPARFRTTFQVAYDDRAVYVFLRMYDPRPDSLVSLLSRRDVRTPSEWIKVVIDGFHDRRSGMQFMVNPAGVKRDANITNDVQEDGSWDAVWDVAVQTDSLGWTAEYAIPFSQLRYTPAEVLTFGFGIWRDVARYGERDAWPTYRGSMQTFASQLGDLVGIEGVGSARRIEVMPYAVTKNVTEPAVGGGWRHPQQQTVGLDLKAGLGPNVTLDATINPDFGQVEADPAVINLSAFEIRFEERRPFFLEGGNLFRCGGPCEGIFYTRRLGRSPQLRSSVRDPLFSRIEGAAKVTGRLESGAQFGLVAVSSAKETGENGRTIEPRTATLVGRFVQDFRAGRSQIGTMITSMIRDLDEDTSPFLRRDASTLLLQGYHRFAERWEVSGYTGRSVVRGSEAAMRRTQLTSVHYAQRPGNEFTYDSTRTLMDGGVHSLTLRRYAGRVRWETITRYAEPGTELNDLGFVTLVNDMMLRNQLTLVSVRPSNWYRRGMLAMNAEQHWTTGGLPSGSSAVVVSNAELTNFWGVEVLYTAYNLGATRCITCARGGPALRMSPTHLVAASLEGDNRRALRPEFGVEFARGDADRSWRAAAQVGLVGRIGTQTSLEIGTGFDRRVDDTQHFANYGNPLSDTTHYTVARLAQSTLSITTRLNVTLTPTVSLQVYAQPFISAGEFTDRREIVAPEAHQYADRYRPYGTTTGSFGAFTSRQFNSNVVLRWEYRLGSQLFLVWQQGRGDGANPGPFAPRQDLGRLFAAHPNNTLLLKFSYWLNP